METTIENNTLVIRIPLATPRPSASGKTFVVASTNGNFTTSVRIDGKPLVIGLNAYVKK